MNTDSNLRRRELSVKCVNTLNSFTGGEITFEEAKSTVDVLEAEHSHHVTNKEFFNKVRKLLAEVESGLSKCR